MPPNTKWQPPGGWCECGYLQVIGVKLLGIDPATGLINPARPATLDPDAVAEFKTYLQSRIVAAQGTYLLKCNFATFVAPEMRAALTAGVTYQVVWVQRNSTSASASLSAASGAQQSAADAYLSAHYSQIQANVAAQQALGINIVQVSFDAIQANPQATLQPMLDSLGLTAPQSAWDVYNPLWVNY
jgi:hypothetical protein